MTDYLPRKRWAIHVAVSMNRFGSRQYVTVALSASSKEAATSHANAFDRGVRQS